MFLSNVTLVLPTRVIPCGSLRIEGGKITEITETSGSPTHTVFAGFIDMHGDMIEQELEPRVRVDFPMEVALNALDARLAASGVTTAYASVSFSRGAREGERRSYEHTSNVIRSLYAAKSHARVDHRIHARFDITFDNAVGVLRDLLDDGCVDLVSLMDHTPGQGQYRNIEIHIKNRAAQQGITEAEAREAIMSKIAEKKRPQDELLHNMQEVSRMCREHGVALASHDDDTVEKTDLMADLGCVIAEFPVTFEAAEVAVKRGLMTAMGAPNAMRGQSYSGNLSARDAHAKGLLSILAADYHPAAILPAIHILAETDPNGLAGAARLATVNPAKALGLTDRGALEVGNRADLLVVDAANRVAMTVSNGATVYSNGTYAPQTTPVKELSHAS